MKISFNFYENYPFCYKNHMHHFFLVLRFHMTLNITYSSNISFRTICTQLQCLYPKGVFGIRKWIPCLLPTGSKTLAKVAPSDQLCGIYMETAMHCQDLDIRFNASCKVSVTLSARQESIRKFIWEPYFLFTIPSY